MVSSSKQDLARAFYLGMLGLTSLDTHDIDYLENLFFSTYPSGLTGTYISIPKVSALASPIIVGHRGIANVVPENTMASFEAALGYGIASIKLDAQPLADGVSGVMHDTTIDRTTSSTGSTTAFTVPQWQNIVADTSSWFGSSVYGNLTVPLNSEVFNRFGNRVVLWVEAKTASAMPDLVTQVVARNLQSSVVLCCATFTSLAAATAAGIATCYVDAAGTTKTPAQIVAAGVNFISVDFTNAAVTSSLITSLKAAGIKVIGYTPNTQYNVATFMAKGGDGFFSDDPVYAAGIYNSYNYVLTSDVFAAQTWHHGMWSPNGTPGVFSNGGYGWNDTTNAGARITQMGYMSPIKKKYCCRHIHY